VFHSWFVVYLVRGFLVRGKLWAVLFMVLVRRREGATLSPCACVHRTTAGTSEPAVSDASGRRFESATCRASRVILLILLLASPCIVCPSQTAPHRRQSTLATAPSSDRLSDEEVARRLQEEELLAAAAATALRGRPPQDGRVGLRQQIGLRQQMQATCPPLGMQATNVYGDGCLNMAHMASARLADEDSLALCQQLGDRGFEGTGAIANNNRSNSSANDLHADGKRSVSEFLLGSVGRAILPVLREGVNRVLDLPRTLVTFAEQGAKCAPIIGYSNKDACHPKGEVYDEEPSLGLRVDAAGRVQADCSNDEALARAMQEQEWLEVRR
jgi:hypothetical protein